MSRTPLATATYDTPQKSARTSGVDFIVIHHAAMTSLDGLIRLMMGAKSVSAHVALKDEQIVSMMDESYRAWSMSDGGWDSRALTVETCNSAGGPDWPISDASYVSLGRLVADWCARHSIPCTREYVIGHGEVYSRFGGSYSTACPGGINLDRVVDQARQLLLTGRHTTMRMLFNTDNPDDATRRALVGEISFDVISAAESTVERRPWGVPINVSQAEWDVLLDGVRRRRKALGLPTGGGTGGDPSVVLDAITASEKRVVAAIPKTFQAK